MTWTASAVGVGAVGVGSSILGGMSAKKRAKKAAKAQAKLTGVMRDEEIRMKKRAAGQQVGAARAGVYANNLQMSGSAKRYVKELDFENMREIAFAEYAKTLEQKAIKKGAQGAGTALFAQAAGDALGFAAQAYGNRATAAAAQPSSYGYGGPSANPGYSNPNVGGPLTPAPVQTNVPYPTGVN